MLTDVETQATTWRMYRFAGMRLHPERFSHMALAAYYDSSADEKRIQSVTLSGVCATEMVWTTFEDRWALALGSVDRLHMAPLMSSKKEFLGWDDNRKQNLLQRLWNAVGELRGQHLLAYTCTVLIPDWSLAKKQIPDLCSPESICVNFCVGNLHFDIESASEPSPLILYFDRTEPFMKKINRVWLRARKNNGTFFSYVRNIIPVDDSERPIQLADMLAWTANKNACGSQYPHQWLLESASTLMIEHYKRVYDFDTILEKYPTGKLRTIEERA